MSFKEEVIDSIINRDENYLIKYSEEISKIFKREYNGADDVKIFIVPVSVFRPGHPYYRYLSVYTYKSIVPSGRYVIPDYLMYRLQYVLAKEYGIVFTSIPESFYIDSQYKTTRIRVTKLELNIK